MDSSRVERLAAAVATMPDGPSRDRFVVLLDELTEPETEDGPAADEPDLDDTDLEDTDLEDTDLDDTDPGNPSETAPWHPFGEPAAAPEVFEASSVATAPAAAQQPAKKRRWRR
jgi:hypothetical protein